jgi:hypothetical protein
VADVFTANVRFATDPPPATAVHGVTYQFKFSATGWPRPTYTLESGNLPNGITLNPDGTLAGTPTIAGDYSGVVKATSGTKTQSQNFTIHVAEPALSVTLTGTGGGTITSSPQGTNPAGISCTSGSCLTTIPFNAVVELTHTADDVSTFEHWGGECSGSVACSFNMTGPKSVTASFTLAPKARIIDAGYLSLSDAYKAAAAFGDVIMTIDSEMPDNGLNINADLAQGKSITIRGGYYADYSKGRSGLPTKLKGPLFISSGTLRVDGLLIR